MRDEQNSISPIQVSDPDEEVPLSQNNNDKSVNSPKCSEDDPSTLEKINDLSSVVDIQPDILSGPHNIDGLVDADQLSNESISPIQVSNTDEEVLLPQNTNDKLVNSPDYFEYIEQKYKLDHLENDHNNNSIRENTDSTHSAIIPKTPKLGVCPYCRKKNSKLHRHLASVHNNEEDVKEFLALPKGSKERRLIIDKLRKRGNFIYNTTNETGDIICVKRSHILNNNESSGYYMPCPNCKGFFSKQTLKLHVRRGPCNLPTEEKGRRDIKVRSRMLLGGFHSRASEILKNYVLPRLRDDNCTRIIKQDELIILYGNKLVLKNRDEHHQKMIRSKMRLLGRFLITIKNLSPEITDLASVCHPSHFDNIIKAINIVARLNEVEAKYKAPTTAADLGTALKFAASILKVECVKRKSTLQQKEDIDDFIYLLTQELGVEINKTVIENRTEQLRHKVVELPKEDDLKEHVNYLRRETEKYLDLLQRKRFNKIYWNELSKLTLVMILTYNRKRPGELARATLDDYSHRRTIDSTIRVTLSEEERKLADSLVRFVIRGKLNRNVPVLLNAHMVKCIEVILAYRKESKVPVDNKYLFAQTNKNDKYYDLSKLCKQYAAKSGIKNQNIVMPTVLRKHLATYCNTLSLDDADIDNVQQFMGHHDKIHKTYYRQQPVAKDILQMSQILSNAAGDSARKLEKPSPVNRKLKFSDTVACNTLDNTRNEKLGISEMQHSNYQQTLDPDSENMASRKRNRLLGNNRNKEATGISDAELSKYQQAVDLDNENLSTRKRKRFLDNVRNKKPRISGIQLSNYQQTLDLDSENMSPRKRKRLLDNTRNKKTPGTSEAQLPKYQQAVDVDKESLSPKKRKRFLDPAENARIKRRSWETPERHKAKEIFESYIENEKIPSMTVCHEAALSVPELSKRTGPQIRLWVSNQITKNRMVKPKGSKRKGWTTPETHLCRNIFKTYIQDDTYPSKSEIVHAIENFPILASRSPDVIKSKIQHEKMKRRSALVHDND